MTPAGLTLLALFLEERVLLVDLLTAEIEREKCRERFNALVQLRAYIGGHLERK